MSSVAGGAPGWSSAVGGQGVTPADPVDVPLLRHPEDEPSRRRLARAGVPRVLVVGPDADAPVCTDPIEDWVREPIDPVELDERRRVALDRYRRASRGVLVDADGLLRVGPRWAPLSDLQRASLFPLLHQLGRPVARSVVTDEYLAAGGRHPRGLLPLLHRLRPRLEALGLELHVLQRGGVVLLPPAEGWP